MPEEAKMNIVVIHLEGDALQWHQSVTRVWNHQGRKLSWDEYIKVVQVHFGEEMYGDPVLEVKKFEAGRIPYRLFLKVRLSVEQRAIDLTSIGEVNFESFRRRRDQLFLTRSGVFALTQVNA